MHSTVIRTHKIIINTNTQLITTKTHYIWSCRCQYIQTSMHIRYIFQPNLTIKNVVSHVPIKSKNIHWSLLCCSWMRQKTNNYQLILKLIELPLAWMKWIPDHASATELICACWLTPLTMKDVSKFCKYCNSNQVVQPWIDF